jgi:uncharacterized cupin superfamily protein
MEEARLVETDAGLTPGGSGWFVVNAHDAAWGHNDRFGDWVSFEGADEAGFTQVGINIHVLAPGQANCFYHRENAQEDFLVLEGECLLLIEEEERRLKAWDFVHCPSGTTHVFVGAGTGPCAILMVGARMGDAEEITYPASDLARRHDAGVAETTGDPKVAYRDCPKSIRIRCPLDLGRRREPEDAPGP